MRRRHIVQQARQDPDVEGDDEAEHPAVSAELGRDICDLPLELFDLDFQPVEPQLDPIQPMLEAIEPTVEAVGFGFQFGEVPFMSRERGRGGPGVLLGTPAFLNASKTSLTTAVVTLAVVSALVL